MRRILRRRRRRRRRRRPGPAKMASCTSNPARVGGDTPGDEPGNATEDEPGNLPRRVACWGD
eukprot:9417348-Pyramimonas_sp.AAC.1